MGNDGSLCRRGETRLDTITFEALVASTDVGAGTSTQALSFLVARIWQLSARVDFQAAVAVSSEAGLAGTAESARASLLASSVSVARVGLSTRVDFVAFISIEGVLTEASFADALMSAGAGLDTESVGIARVRET